MGFRKCLFPAALLAAGLSGCAGVPADWGRGEVAQTARDRGREVPQAADAQAFTQEALTRPMTPDTAVQLALLNNPSVRVQAASLGVAAAEVYEAGRLANPVFSGAYLKPRNEASADFTLGIAFNFVSLLFLPANTRYASAQFEAAKLEAASATVELAADVEAAYFRAVGAEQVSQMRQIVARSARARAELVQRFFDAGNLNRRELAMEQAAASQAQLDLLSAQAETLEARSELNRAMGLSAAQDTWTLEARLSEPYSDEDELQALLQLATESRLDIAAARSNAQALATRFGFDRRARFIGDVQVGIERERDDGEVKIGPTLEFELPLFNWGTGRAAMAPAALDRSEAKLDALTLDMSNEVKLAHAKAASAKARAEVYRTALIPLREQVVAEAQKEQNYMILGVFELIETQREEYEAYEGYLEAVRDWWTARAELTRAVGRRLPGSGQSAAPTLDPQELTRPKGGAMEGMEHQGMEGMQHKGMKEKEPSEAVNFSARGHLRGRGCFAVAHGESNSSLISDDDRCRVCGRQGRKLGHTGLVWLGAVSRTLDSWFQARHPGPIRVGAISTMRIRLCASANQSSTLLTLSRLRTLKRLNPRLRAKAFTHSAVAARSL